MKRERPFLQHMLDAVQRIKSYLKGVSHDAFIHDLEKQDAVIRQLEILGEAAGRVSPKVRELHSEVPWRQVTGMRHKLIHDYFVVDLEVVWQTATEDVPLLEPAINQALADLDE